MEFIKTFRKIRILCPLVLILLNVIVFSQENVYSEAPIIFENGIKKSTQITVRFKDNVVLSTKGEKKLNISKFSDKYQNIKKYFKKLEEKHGELEIIKLVPNSVYGDNYVTHKRTKKRVKVKDLSQLVTVKFKEFVDIESIIYSLENNPHVLYAHGPITTIDYYTPNDNYISDQWYLTTINAFEAWDIAKGSGDLKVGIVESRGIKTTHIDLNGQFNNPYDTDYQFWHGTAVSGVVGAKTNNTEGIAGIAFNSELDAANYHKDQTGELVSKIPIMAGECDILNMSFGTHDIILDCSLGGKTCSLVVSKNYPAVEDAIELAISGGTIIVAAAGNKSLNANNSGPCDMSCDIFPYTAYPAAYNFGELGQVIAVSATDNQDVFAGGEDYNHGNFIDYAAPGISIYTTSLSGDLSTDIYDAYDGTSFAAPVVSGTIALLLSINESLELADIEDILTNTSVDLGIQGKDDYYGNGRVNAYKALKYTVENYGGTFNQDVIIPADDTWNLQPGVTLTFENNGKLIVKGTLNVNGTSSEKVVFDFGERNYPNGIWFEEGSSGTINNAIIKNAYYGVRAYKSAPTVKYSEITQCSIGLYFSNQRIPQIESFVYKNAIHDNGMYNLYFYNSNGDIRSNNIYNSTYGVYCSFYSSPSFGNVTNKGYNTIHDNSNGVYIYDSNPTFGIEGCIEQAGDNAIENNSSYNMKANYYSSVLAENNWWGSYPPNPSKIQTSNYSTIDYTPSLNYGIPNPLGKIGVNVNNSPEETVFNSQVIESSTLGNNKKYNYDETWPLLWKLRYVHNLIEVKDYDFAYKICKSILDEHPDSTLSYWALDMMWKASKKEKKVDFKNYLKEKKNSKKKKKLYGDMELILTDNEEMKSKIPEILDEIEAKYNDETIEEASLLKKLVYYVHEEKDYEMAKSIISEMGRRKYSKELLNEANSLIGFGKVNASSKIDIKDSYDEGLVIEYKLFGNYPNPFNPSTKIRYSLPFVSVVNLDIYDVMGRLIKSFEFNSQSTGRHEIVWDGTNSIGGKVASGIYFYKIKMQSLEGNGETFEKTAKLLLMK